ncbi:helix-turn-helix transcriptional regulator [Clostridium sp. P21]|uniref:Helix-turn-helix transcriptional regulator n=1 Tax=Clostridium muellerianum TaxID=2716538 RepID=A0A7Y0HLG2_9CLOT|nr:AraC family transcriptional regulator [Clostridium muellerianum]NMM61874.1 helix-turn-helix transcriptional regulator [Clostridium muellerianum]
MKVKVIELLLYLISDLDYEKNEAVYFSKSSIEKIKEARRIIIGNIDKHITIKEISQRVNMNSTDLERGFKNVYGDTIFSYSRSYRMKKAKELLSDAKLSKAFKDTFSITPVEYRKR